MSSTSANVELAISCATPYFALYDGKPKTFADAQPLIDALFDTDYCIVGPDGSVVADRAQVMTTLAGFFENEGVTENVVLKPIGDDKVDYQMDFTLKGKETLHMHSVAICKDGKFQKSVVVEDGKSPENYNAIFHK